MKQQSPTENELTSIEELIKKSDYTHEEYNSKMLYLIYNQLQKTNNVHIRHKNNSNWGSFMNQFLLLGIMLELAFIIEILKDIFYCL